MIIGLTGSIAVGKTTTAQYFKTLGLYVIDADRIAHELTKLGSPVLHEIVRIFGKDILYYNGQLNRNKLATIIFSDYSMKVKLEKIIHKYVMLRIQNLITYNVHKYKHILLDVPLLFETGLHRLCDCNIVVYTSYNTQIARLKLRNNFNYVQIKQRLLGQWSIKFKIKLSDFIISNIGSKKDLKTNVQKLYRIIDA
ncbi:MAG: dephospho-CoA kinase [Endomicrobium sp.]|jgi:dephospho-CoA kinase|nr:dephospho-CoA kinase [Endomicrobium sp.]